MPPKTRKKTTRSADKIVKAGIFNTELFYPRIVPLTLWNLTSHFLFSPFIGIVTEFRYDNVTLIPLVLHLGLVSYESISFNVWEQIKNFVPGIF